MARHMRNISVLLSALILWCALSIPVSAVDYIPSVLRQLPELNPNLSQYPDSSLVDRSSSLDAPAGRHGFVTAHDGHFYFADGARARFFGLNLAKETVFIDKAQIDRLAALFARSGINLVRIHHIDDVSGLLDPAHPGKLNTERLDRIDYWIAKLRERGIYLYLDLNDYRTFTTAEGVRNGEKLGRGARPYSVFNQQLIDLQLQYARQFLVEHINPYTQLSYANDPAVALVEIHDENGLFIRRNDWQDLIEPYRTQLQQQWNAWLRYRYATTAVLRKAWTNHDGECALAKGESLEDANIKLPVMTLTSNPPQNCTDPLQAPARVSDGALFAYAVQTNFLQTMKGELKEMGIKVPITAVGAQNVLPDLMATAAATDYIGINFYWDHPTWDDNNDWQLPFYFSLQHPAVDNQQYAFPATVSLARMHDKPLVVRELGYCFPNPYRGLGMLESAAYGAFLNLDALILFTYDAGISKRSIGYFDIHLDPLRWGLVAQSSRLFLSGEVTASPYTVGIGYSEVDAFTWSNYVDPIYQLAGITRVENYTIPEMPHPFDLLIASGRSLGAKWSGKNLLLFANAIHTDLHNQGMADGIDTLYGYHLQSGRSGDALFSFRGIGFDVDAKRMVSASPGYTLASLDEAGLLPIATAGNLALGFIDTTKHIIGFRNLSGDLALRVAVDALREWRSAPISHTAFDMNRWQTTTGQLERDISTQLLRVETPTIQAIAGNFTPQTPAYVGAIKMTTSTPIATLVAESLDGKPIASSTHLLLKMTSRAINNGTAVVPSPNAPKPFKLTALGGSPIRTDGKATDLPTRIEVNGKWLLSVGMQNGTWEYLAEPDRALLFLDTGDITVTLPSVPKLVRLHTADDTIDLVPDDNTLSIPAGIRCTEIIWNR